jgi:hypothetical protein
VTVGVGAGVLVVPVDQEQSGVTVPILTLSE